MWMVAATIGMRRSELAGVAREDLDLDNGALRVADTRVVVAGRTVDSDGKTDSGVRTLSLDPGTVELLRHYLGVLAEEREAFGTGYRDDHGKLMRFEDGRMVHADTITRRFNRLVDRAGAEFACTTSGTPTRPSSWTWVSSPRSSASGWATRT